MQEINSYKIEMDKKKIYYEIELSKQKKQAEERGINFINFYTEQYIIIYI